MKKSLPLVIAFFVFANQLLAQQQVPEQIKKGKWMIGHDVFELGYQMRTIKEYSNGVYTGMKKYRGFYTELIFQSPYWGGASGFSVREDNYDETGEETGGNKGSGFSFTFRPSVGRFISDRLLLGAELHLYLSKENTEFFSGNDSEKGIATYTTIGLGPHVRYYFGALKGKQLFHAGLSGGFNYSTMKQKSFDNGIAQPSYKTKEPAFYAKPYVGSSWFAGKRWTFSLSASYRMETSRYTFNYINNPPAKRNKTFNHISLDGSVSFTL